MVDGEMKQVKKMPNEGQFVAVWAANGEVWSNTYKWCGTDFLKCHEYHDKWVESSDCPYLNHESPIYFIAE